MPVELKVPSPRTSLVNPLEPGNADHETIYRTKLDRHEEVLEGSAFHQAEVKRQLAKYYNKKLRGSSFQVGDLVLKKLDAAARLGVTGKLNSNWAGLYVIIKVIPSARTG